MRPRISVVVNTLNEEKNLPYALRSVRSWVDEIVVVDMCSQDRTVAIAREYGAKVYSHEPMGFVEPARAFAVAQAGGDWILMLDADELVPFPLSRRLREIAEGDGADVVQIHWLNYLLGAPAWYTGWGPHQDMHMRFFKPGFVEAGSAIHDSLRSVGGARVLDIPYQPGLAIIHFSCRDIADLLERMNRYTTIEAQQARESGEEPGPWKAVLRACKEFARRYVRLRGYRDVWRGFYLSLFMAFYRITTVSKITELRRVGPRAAVEDVYRREAERLLTFYESVDVHSSTDTPVAER